MVRFFTFIRLLSVFYSWHMISSVCWLLTFPASEGWLTTCHHWRIAVLFQVLKDNLALNFFCSNFFCKALSGWSNCCPLKQWALLSISFLMKFPQLLIFFFSFQVFLSSFVAVNGTSLLHIKVPWYECCFHLLK